jgi:hypothetical protein
MGMIFDYFYNMSSVFSRSNYVNLLSPMEPSRDALTLPACEAVALLLKFAFHLPFSLPRHPYVLPPISQGNIPYSRPFI